MSNNKIYTKEELRAFETELEKVYRVHKTAAGQQLSYIDFDQYLIDKRACVRQQPPYGVAICNVPLFQELTAKFEQLKDLRSKRAYAKQKELEELAETEG